MTDSSSPSPRTSDRRTFLATVVGCAAAAALGGCTVPPRSFRAPPGGRVRVPLSAYPELESEGGVVKVLTPRHGPVFVRRGPEGKFDAISAVCTHQGGTVALSAQGFRCPLHGSTYDRDGKNTGGPAQEPLDRYRAELAGSDVVLILEGKS